MAIPAFTVIVGITSPALTETGCEPEVKAILFDGHDLVPGGLAPVRRAVGQELRHFGVRLTWMKSESSEAAGSVLRVVILPHTADGWGRTGETLGAVRLEGLSPSSVYVFYPAVTQVLGEPANTTSILGGPSGTIWTRGLARIILHEMVHFLLPGRPHDVSGLFAKNLNGRELLGPQLELESATHSALLERLCAHGR